MKLPFDKYLSLQSECHQPQGKAAFEKCPFLQVLECQEPGLAKLDPSLATQRVRSAPATEGPLLHLCLCCGRRAARLWRRPTGTSPTLIAPENGYRRLIEARCSCSRAPPRQWWTRCTSSSGGGPGTRPTCLGRLPGGTPLLLRPVSSVRWPLGMGFVWLPPIEWPHCLFHGLPAWTLTLFGSASLGLVVVVCRDLVEAAISETSELVRFPSLQVSLGHKPRGPRASSVLLLAYRL